MIPTTITLSEGLEYTVLCSFYNGSCFILFGVDYSGSADFKYICCYAEPDGGSMEYIRPVAGSDYDDIFVIFRDRIDAECAALEDTLEEKRLEDEAL